MISYKKIPYIKFVPIIIITLLVFKMITNLEKIGSIFKTISSLLVFFIWGFVIAYLLNPLMVFIEKKTQMKRVFSVLIIYTLFIGLIVFIITLITPNLIKNTVDLFNNIPKFADKSYNWSINFLSENELVNRFNITSYLETHAAGWTKDVTTYFAPGLQLIIDNLMGLSSLLMKFMSGIVISVYFLLDKESIIYNIKKFIYSILSESASIKLINFGRLAHVTFAHYFVGKIIDSVIFGSITFIGFTILGIPYALAFSLVIGVTNMIPYFGNIIGMAPAVIITLFFNPIKSLEIVLFVVTLSNIDGWFISPKIIGDKVGLSPLLIILGLVLGGGLFGIIGMLIGIPTIALVKILLEGFMNQRTKDKRII